MIEEFPLLINMVHKHSLHVDRLIVILDEDIIISEALEITPTCVAFIGLLRDKKTISIATNFIFMVVIQILT